MMTMTSPMTMTTTDPKSPLEIAHRQQRFGAEEWINDAEAAEDDTAAAAARTIVVVVDRSVDDYKDACCGVEVTTRCNAGPRVVNKDFR